MAGTRTLMLGHFGSGKTEVAVATALKHAANGERPLLLDLDFITPYFRARDAAVALQAAGVVVVAPEGELRTAELPAITSRAISALMGYAGPVVVDVGGDEGARVLGSLAARVPPGSRTWMVVNPRRPGTGTAEEIAEYARWLAALARVPITALVSNPHVMGATTPDLVRQNHQTVLRAAALLGLPVAFAACRAELAPELPDLAPLLPLTLHMRVPWQE